MNRLRTALGDSSADPIYIETMVGMGYRFIAEVAWSEVGDPASRARQGPMTTPPSAMLPLAAPTPEDLSIPQSLMSEPARKASSEVLIAQFSNDQIMPADTSLRQAGNVWRRRRPALGYALAIAGLLAILTSKVWKRLPTAGYHEATQGVTAHFPDLSRQPATGREDLSSSGAAAPAAAPVFRQATFRDATEHVSASHVNHSGTMLAYSDRNGLYIRTLDRGVDQLAWAGIGFAITQIGWTPDDSTLIVSSTDTRTQRPQIWSISPATGRYDRLVDDAANGVTSIRGARLAFTRRNGAELWLSGMQGEAAHQIGMSLPEGSLSVPMWSANGKRISYEKRVIPSEATAADGEAAWSYQWEFDTVDADTGRTLDREIGLHLLSAATTSDGRVYFLAAKQAPKQESGLFGTGTDPASGHFLSPSKQPGAEGDLRDLSVSDDGRVVAALVEAPTPSVYVGQTRLPQPGLSDVRRLVHPAPDNFPHSWTRDGKAVLFESDNEDKYAIYSQEADGSPAHLRARSIGGAVFPVSSPDGRWILFLNLYRFHANAIFRAPVNGGAIQRVPTKDAVEGFQCSSSPNGQCVLRVKEGDFLVFKALDPVTGEGAELGRVRWSEILFGDWSVSPDGKTLALAKHDSARPSIQLVQLRSGKLSQTKDIPLRERGLLRSVNWRPDGIGFFIQMQEGREYTIAYVDREGRTTLLRHPLGPSWVVPSPRGHRIAFVEYGEQTNVWVRR